MWKNQEITDHWKGKRQWEGDKTEIEDNIQWQKKCVVLSYQ